jgi:hypothetical protein
VSFSGTVAIEGCFLFELVVSLFNSLFPCLLAIYTANLTGDVCTFFTILTLRSALPKHDVNIHRANGIGRNNTSAPIGKADRMTPPINLAGTGGKGNSSTKNDTFKMQISLDRHNQSLKDLLLYFTVRFSTHLFVRYYLPFINPCRLCVAWGGFLRGKGRQQCATVLNDCHRKARYFGNNIIFWGFAFSESKL